MGKTEIGCVVFLLLLVTQAPATEIVETNALAQRIDSLIHDLSSENYPTREKATKELGQLGDDAIPPLEQAARSDDPEVRVRARKILNELRLGIAPDWPSEMVQLVLGYKQLGENERIQALNSLQAALKEKAAPFLLSRIGSKSEHEAEQALALLKKLSGEKAAQRVIGLLKDPKNDWERQALAWALSQLGRTLDAIRSLADMKTEGSYRKELFEKGVEELISKLKNHQYEKAAKEAHQFAEAAPSESRFLYLEAEALEALDVRDDAKALREKALAFNADTEEPHWAAGEMLGKLRRNRLAAHEWEMILKIPPVDDVYDINAHLRLSSIDTETKHFMEAADHLEKALDLFRKGRNAGKGMGVIIGSDENSMEKQVRSLRKRGALLQVSGREPDKAREEEDKLRININITVKDGKLAELRKALKTVAGTLTMNVQPHELRIFDIKDTVLRYDLEKKQITLLLRDSPCGPPAPFALKEGQTQVAIMALDCCYIFKINPATGQTEKIARYEKDYTVKLQPGARASVLTDVEGRINGKRYDWNDLLKGVFFDYLPEKFDIEVIGATPSKKRETLRLKMNVKEPSMPPDESNGDEEE